MGVPKFFRYISERYPCLSEFVQEHQIPVFDNLYLDMNGIIHTCSHPDDNNPHFRITEEKIFSDIFHYIEVLFRMIKPLKVFFMAVDGVAPRAKMNQQRGRRFRSAKEAAKSEAEALKKGDTLPEGDRFDSNCITPGTEFMVRLHEQLKYFVVHKISTDKLWGRCKIILSGHETPGEGEHKIMDYIRYIRAQPGYNPNTRHCLYGLDADLIMLGLCTHDPHFSLLREEVKFGKKVKRNNVPEQIRFYLLHLSLMREYLELEFSSLKKSLDQRGVFQFDIEKIIDDWILMGFLVGNDFIPNLPNLHITNGSLPVLYQAYIEVLPTLDGYINEAGALNLQRFEKFIMKLADIDIKNFEEAQDDQLYMKMKTGRKFPGSSGGYIEDGTQPPKDPALAALIKTTDEMDISSDDDLSNEEEAFKCFKNDYYRNKLEYQKVTPEVMREQAEGYVRAIQWNLHYYYNGVCSWSWFYPHHYAPYISDIKGFCNMKLNFELGTPFKPYEQLLAVLPPASKNHLPSCYHSLMTDDSSLIKHYYPDDFQTDLNGKRQEWEAVVLVPFIDEKLLLEAMKPCNENLTLEELRRNQHGPMLVYQYSEDSLGSYDAPNYFPSVEDNHAQCSPVDAEELSVPQEKLVKGAYPGAKFDVFYPGFPTLRHLKFTHELQKSKVRVFEQASRGDNMILTIWPKESLFDDSLPEHLLRGTVWVGWPHLMEAKVVAVSNKKTKYSVLDIADSGHKVEMKSENMFYNEIEGVTQHYRDRMGINFGETKVAVHVMQLIGRKYIFTSDNRVNLEKQYASTISTFPLQGVIEEINNYNEEYRTIKEASDVFPVGTECFLLTNPFYGSQGTILDSTGSQKNNQMKVSLLVSDEPDFTTVFKVNAKLRNSYTNLPQSASHLAISNHLFSRVTGSIFIDTQTPDGVAKTVNIGLDLKFNRKNQETPGYTKKIDNSWCYSSKTIELVQQYLEKFPEVFRYLANNHEDRFTADDIFGVDESDDKVKEMQNWLKTLPTYKTDRVICNGSQLEPIVVEEIEDVVEKTKTTPRNIIMQVRPQYLYKPDMQMGYLAPDITCKTQVFDRIVNVREGYSVPLGLKGTVIAVHMASNLLNEDELYDIVFDKAFPGGMALNCSEDKGYRLPKTAFINITHGKRMMEEKTGVPGVLRALAKERNYVNNFSPNAVNTNLVPKQQNSAFASFNKPQTPQYMVNFQNTGANPTAQNQSQFAPSISSQNQSRNQKKPANNSFYYLSDFRTNDVKLSKENERRQPHEPINTRSVPKSSSNLPGKPNSVDTDFLKRILKIQNSNLGQTTTGKTNDPNVRNGFVPSQPGSSNDNNSSSVHSKSNVSATADLLNYYQCNNLGCPRYTYLSRGSEILAQITLPHERLITGRAAKSREEASENVAREALNMLKSQSFSRADFPTPPRNWVQGHAQLNKVPAAPQNNHQPNTGVASVATNFVPLQAIKKKSSSRSATNKNENRDLSTGDASRTGDKQTDVSERSATEDTTMPTSQAKKKNRNRKRKTRIAANFLME